VSLKVPVLFLLLITFELTILAFTSNLIFFSFNFFVSLNASQIIVLPFPPVIPLPTSPETNFNESL